MHDGAEEHQQSDDGLRGYECYRLGYQNTSRQDAVMVRTFSGNQISSESIMSKVSPYNLLNFASFFLETCRLFLKITLLALPRTA